MPQLTLTFPSGLAPHDVERIADGLERCLGCEIESGAGVPLTRLERIQAVVGLDVLLAVAAQSTNLGPFRAEMDRSVHDVRVLRDRLRETLR